MAGRDLLKIVSAEGEGQKVEFKARAAENLPAPRFIPTENAFRVQLFSSFPPAGLSEEEAEMVVPSSGTRFLHSHSTLSVNHFSGY
jgi:hypothetical protein